MLKPIVFDDCNVYMSLAFICKLSKMGKYRRLTHVIYKFNFQNIFTPKYRFRILTGHVSSMLDHDIRTICEWKDVFVEEMNIQLDHAHMVVTIPPKFRCYIS